MIPTLSYLTLLDKFIGANFIILLWQVIVGAFAEVAGPVFDVAALIAAIAAWAITHIYFFWRACRLHNARTIDYQTRDAKRAKQAAARLEMQKTKLSGQKSHPDIAGGVKSKTDVAPMGNTEA